MCNTCNLVSGLKQTPGFEAVDQGLCVGSSCFMPGLRS